MNSLDLGYECHHPSHREETAPHVESYLYLRFPEDKKKLAKLSHDEKMAWYAFQFTAQPLGGVPIFLSTLEFQSFWKWHVLFRMKLKRFYFRLKNFETFKSYPHITEMKKKVKKHSI